MIESADDDSARRFVLPYSRIVEQEGLKRALEIAYVSPSVGGALATGRRGTAKSTTVRAFARMVFGDLPVTLPLGATDDRIVGGWNVDELMKGTPRWMPGLIEEAGGKGRTGILYIDEINLLEDHLVNIILDAAATGILTVQRDGVSRHDVPVRFNLVGTMNPEEGGLRPQLLDRFGMVVWVDSVEAASRRAEILTTVLEFERLLDGPPGALASAYDEDRERHRRLDRARDRVADVMVPEQAATAAGTMAAEFRLEGHRGELALLRAARAIAALAGADEVRAEHLAQAAPLTLVHRRDTSESGTLRRWTADDDAIVTRVLRAHD
ncbi:AAA family ATPase [Actinoplanes sp. CA-252034]|uniref:AAA family ATPase n=1 Tax=Actinoplanes sp. CA-252034 TaxID=3239906 RepID=UPI003D9781AE